MRNLLRGILGRPPKKRMLMARDDQARQLMEFPLEILQGSIDIVLKASSKGTLVNMLIVLTVESNRDFEALVEDLNYWRGIFEREVFLEGSRLEEAESDEGSRVLH